MKIMRDIDYSEQRTDAKSLDVYLPEGKTDAVFLYMHGGGIENGSKCGFDATAEYLTERGVAFVSINYRMYPDARYPDFICDAAEAIAWTHNSLKSIFGCERLYVGGSSAGGYLSMMLCFDPRYLAAVGLDNSAIAGYFHDAGQPTAHFNVLKYQGIDSRRVIVDESAPLYYVGTAEAYPPMRFIVSDSDMQNRYEQTMLILSTMKHFGYTGFDHTVMHGTHCAYCHKLDENGVSILGAMIFDFIKSTQNNCRS